MTEDDARSWVTDRFGVAARDRLTRLVDAVAAENAVQNLVAPASLEAVWARHVVDSAQLLALAPPDWKRWLDIGTGGGFPGMVIALLAPDRSVIMVEPRRKRADFLQRCITLFDLRQASVELQKVEAIDIPADVISARAVARLERLFVGASHCAKGDTTWLLPRGRSGADAKPLRDVLFHVEHSLTDPTSCILVARGKPA